MRAAGVTQVRNEIEVIDFTIWAHLDQGVDLILISDNGSTDGTLELLQDLSKNDERIILYRNDGPYLQEQEISFLASEAYRMSCDWVIPFDGDEIWISKNKLINDLSEINASAINIEVENFIQNKNYSKMYDENYLTVNWKVPKNYSTAGRIEIENKTRSSIEIEWIPKNIIKTSSNLRIMAGAHSYTNQDQNIINDNNFRIMQVPIRSYEHLVRKAEHGIRLKEAGFPYLHGWECHLWAEKYLTGTLPEEWLVNCETNGIVTRYDGSHFTLEKDETVSVLYKKYLDERNL
jgi:glycosyltransferase involved in cell wall biosynthesis